MKSRIAALAVIILSAALVTKPALSLGRQASPAQDHSQHHPDASPQATAPPPAEPRAQTMDMMARMKAHDEKLDSLVKKMNAATGSAKTDAIAELLTTLVADRRMAREPMMANMMSMMDMMSGAKHAPTAPPK
jgi:hypothetical protein